MSRITDYGFLFQTTFGTSKTNLVNNIQLSQSKRSIGGTLVDLPIFLDN